ncbi:MAG: ribosome-associated translation inhibitor RaiA [Chlamydia sp.]
MTKKEKAIEFDQGYNIVVTGRHVHVTEGMKNHAIDRISRLEKIGDQIIDIHVTMDIQKQSHRVDLIMKYGHTTIRSHAVTSDMYTSIDRAVVKLEAQLKRYKQKIQDHHEKGHPIFDIHEKVVSSFSDLHDINDEIEDESLKAYEEPFKPHKVVSQEVRSLKILTEEEAVMKMDLSGAPFIIFRSEEKRDLRVIHRRTDGNYGIIELES